MVGRAALRGRRAPRGPPVPHRIRTLTPRQVFIAGCPRSGTSALTFLLNEHPAVAIGFERYKRVRGFLDPFHFDPERFLHPLRIETDVLGEALYKRLAARFEAGSVELVGDKAPLYTEVLPQLLDRFPAARFVILVRRLEAVAASFERRAADTGDWWPAENDHRRAAQFWNRSLERARAAAESGARARLFLLPYEPFYGGDERWLEALFGFLSLSITPRVRRQFAQLGDAAPPSPEALPESALAAVLAQRDAALDAWAHEWMAAELERAIDPPPWEGAGDETVDDAARARERAALLAEMRTPPPSTRPDEIPALEKRYTAQGGALAARGDRVRALERGRARDPRVGQVTFVVPHQRPTSGGVHVIREFARHLSPYGTAAVAVRSGEARPIPGVAVAATPDLRDLPDADVLLIPADIRDMEAVLALPRTKGRVVLMLQGYGTPGNPDVDRNMRVAAEAVAVASWLVGAAHERGCRCVYTPPGLARDLFRPGTPAEEREAVVSFMTHDLDWKGGAIVHEALQKVRAARPEIVLSAFGHTPPELPAEFVERPSRQAVADILRRAAVHVVGSFEEGLGLPGLEAIACGAALATTDTKGSRDYAVPGETALVSPPGDADALAENVLRLIDDPQLRGRLAAAGRHQVLAAYPPWPEAARRLAHALAGATG